MAWPSEWPAPEGTRAARLFALPKHLVATSRLHPTGLDVLTGCAFWKRTLEESAVREEASRAAGWLMFDGGDDASETFYETYFPTDIPDEWSSLEREKSHSS